MALKINFRLLLIGVLLQICKALSLVTKNENI